MSFNINMNMTMDSVINDLLKFQNKLFNNVKKGEAHELRNELNSQYAWERKEGVKRVIANMTVGKDVSSLFPHVVKNMQTEDLEMKKLIYLYLINYAKSQPELVILAVNTFVKDTEDNNPLIRALAIRTMGCIRVDKITDYLCDPLGKALKDDDPYVRKTAAIAVAKLFDINAELCVDNGFILALLELLSDSNPVVVSNAVAALMEINELSPNSKALVVTFPILTKLLRAMNECTEWGQIQIMECLSEYKAQEPREAEGICERILPRLSHANASVVLMAIRLLFINLPQIQNEELKTKVINKIPPALITLLSESSEVQFVLLKNLQLILQKYPDLLNKDIRMFFCKYNDPLYVKLEKLDVIIRLTNEHNCEQVLLELKEYANEVDMDFVKKSIRAIGQLALQVPDVTPKAVQTLVELIQNKVDFVVQEVVVVMKDIFRHYPNQHEGVIPILCEHLDSINSSEAKVSLIWILGEYSGKINNSVDIMTSFLENFTEESTNVQLMLLTSTVKLFLARPSEAQDLVLKNLKIATEGENPDVRDRAYIYWRLLSTDSQATQKIVLAQKPILSTNLPQLDNQVIDRLMKELSSLASVYHKLPETFIQLDRPEVDSVMSLQDHQNSSTMFQASESTQGSSSIPASAQQTLANQEPEELLIAF